MSFEPPWGGGEGARGPGGSLPPRGRSEKAVVAGERKGVRSAAGWGIGGQLINFQIKMIQNQIIQINEMLRLLVQRET